jgi:S1-C subfamily serine protease
MNRYSFVAVFALAAVGTFPGKALGQEPGRPDELAPRGPERVMQFVMNRRARLGLKVNLRARPTDSLGAYVDAVTPNGPAAKAGIQSGDLITKVDGKSVLAGGRAEGNGDRESLPGLHLIELAARLEPNDTVAIEFRRGKERKTVSVVTADEPDIAFDGQPGGRAMSFRYFRPDGPDPMGMSLGDSDLERHFGGGAPFLFGPLADLELAPLNPELGQYFGATSGVLVISVPKDSELGLRGGDVVMNVDGRKPASPSQLLRILRSYERGENFKMDILRKQKRETITGKLGDKPKD